MVKQPITITLDPDVIAQVDAIAKAQRSTRSALINMTLAQQFLGDHDRPIRDETTPGATRTPKEPRR
jgi:predicted transcriptional regulator